MGNENQMPQGDRDRAGPALPGASTDSASRSPGGTPPVSGPEQPPPEPPTGPLFWLMIVGLIVLTMTVAAFLGAYLGLPGTILALALPAIVAYALEKREDRRMKDKPE